ncbi:MAG: hypothetical protein D6677_09795 [Calditrichaeota bacterium]|nr:MAG: hypothetical protein D6677_09795 [Calditrichota bacterium]
MKRRTKILTIAFILSLLFHIALFVILQQSWLLNLVHAEKKSPGEREIVVRFPENKPRPRTIVENQNANNIKPRKADLLSDRDATARNPRKTTERGPAPLSSGNTPLPENNPPQKAARPFQPFKFKPSRPFNRNALTNKAARPTDASAANRASERRAARQNSRSNATAATSRPGQQMQQKKFSVEEVGALSLSTYKWNWAPYINKLKRKHMSVWFPPSAYSRLGLIHGRTKIYFEIDRQGRLLTLKILGHKGHESLRTSSEESIRNIFPFLPLPDDFPDDKLGITATLIYPDLKKLFKRR